MNDWIDKWHEMNQCMTWTNERKNGWMTCMKEWHDMTWIKMIEWVNEWMVEWLNEWLLEWMTDWKNECMNEWMNEWIKWWMAWHDMTWHDITSHHMRCHDMNQKMNEWNE